MTRAVSLAAVMFAVLAPVLFVLIFFLVSIGYLTAGQTLSPFAITATVLGLVSSVWAVVLPRTRVVGVTTLLVMAPCAILAGLSALSLASG